MWYFDVGEKEVVDWCPGWPMVGEKAGTKSASKSCEPGRLPGEVLKTEKSSAKRGVQSSLGVGVAVLCGGLLPSILIPGVWNTGLGKKEVVEEGVCLGVGG